MRWSIAPAPRCAPTSPAPAPGRSCRRDCADGETIVVNAGFVQNTMQDRGQQDRAVGRLVTGDPVKLTGYIRFPESAGTLTPPENTVKRLWFTRDHLAMARALGWGEDGKAVAPFYIDLEAARARERHSKARPAHRPSQGRSSAIRHHLVHAGVRGRDRVRRVVARAAPRLGPAAAVVSRTRPAGTFVRLGSFRVPR